MRKSGRSGTAYYYVNDLVGKGMLVDAVKIQGIEVAHIMMLESEQPFHEYDPDFFHRFPIWFLWNCRKIPPTRATKG